MTQKKQGRRDTMMRRMILVTAAAFLFCALPAAAQAQDPTLVYETTIPGYYLASGRGLAVDDAGNAYMFGRFIGDQDQNHFFVGKLDAEGDVVWTKSVTGEDHDVATGIHVADGKVYLTGWTDSADFPTTADALYPSQIHFRDAFLMIFGAADGKVLYSTYFGGDYTDHGNGVAVNAAGEIVLVGSTWSTDFPTVDPLQAENGSYPYDSSDAFITRLSADGQEILYSTYYGGSSDDDVQGMALDEDGNVYFAGTTLSNDYPLMNPYQPSRIGGRDGFITKISADGSAVDFSTYLGGEDLELMGGIALDAANHVYVGGSTRSITFPTTPGSFQEEFVGEIDGCEVPFGGDYNCDDMFAAKLSADGSSLVYSTFIGGHRIDQSRDLAVNSAGEAYLVGYTFSDDFPPDGIDSSGEIVVAKLNAAGSDLVYSHTVDSGSANAGHGIAVDASGDVTFTGAVNVPADFYVARLTEPGTAGVGDGIAGSRLRLGPGRPNPFRGSTQVAYTLGGERAAPVHLGVYDAAGRLVRTLVDGTRAPGRHTAAWNGTDEAGTPLSAGVYFYRLQTNGENRTGRVLLVK
ncbi:MAG: T9SS type A sorting domain-containing protein [Candidatus Eisenbacteria bacterium]|nr:T9SS type A sorting domain-containing protein [Candidatus Eisenbacteria bacterium]